MEPREKILSDVQSIKTKYLDGINTMRALTVTDHLKLFQGLETLISGYTLLEQLDNYLKNCDPAVCDILNNKLQETCHSEATEYNEDHLENSNENSLNDIFEPSMHETDPIDLNGVNVIHDIKVEKVYLPEVENEPTVKKRKIQPKYDNKHVSAVDNLNDWQLLNERAMNQDPCLIEHVQSYETPEKWIIDILRDDLLLEFEENPIEMLSSPMFSLLFGHWNIKFLESFNDPQFCCRNSLNQVMKKSNRRLTEKVRVKRARFKLTKESLSKSGKENTDEWNRIVALDEEAKAKMERIARIVKNQKANKKS